MRRLASLMPAVMLLAGLLLCGAAVWTYFASGPRANALSVDRSALDELASRRLEPGDYDVALRIVNHSNEQQRVVGFTPT